VDPIQQLELSGSVTRRSRTPSGSVTVVARPATSATITVSSPRHESGRLEPGPEVSRPVAAVELPLQLLPEAREVRHLRRDGSVGGCLVEVGPHDRAPPGARMAHEITEALDRTPLARRRAGCDDWSLKAAAPVPSACRSRISWCALCQAARSAVVASNGLRAVGDHDALPFG